MRLRHIEVFHAVYTSGSMTQAARLLNVSQPSISKVLAHAESQLGFRLFERTHGKLVPTPEAERLIQPVSELFVHLGEVRRVATNLKDAGEGRIRLACTPALGLQVVPGLVATYINEHPGILFEIETLHHGEISSALLESRIDLGLAFETSHVPGVVARKLCTKRMVLIAPRSMALDRTRPVPLEHVAELPLIQLHGRSPLGNLVQARLDALDVSPRVVAVAETYHLAQSLVAQNIGVALVDEFTAHFADAEEIDVLELDHAPAFDVSLLSLADVPLSRPAKQFVSHAASSLST